MAEITVRDVGIQTIIDSIKPRQLLWNPEDEHFKNKFKKAKAWREIARELQVPETTAKAKWKNVKDVFRKELNRRPLTKPEDYEGTWKYFKSLWFLYQPEDAKNKTDEDDDASYYGDSAYNDKEYIKLEPNDKNETVYFVNEDALADRLDEEFDEPAAKRTKVEEDDYDMMFLKSLAPYFRALRPMKKLSLRNKIQELLLQELGSQT